MSDMREQFEAAQAADLAIRNRAAARPDGTQFETRAPKERVEAPKAARLNLSLAMDDSNPTVQRIAQERAAEQIEAIARKAAAEVMMQMFPGLYDEHTPQVVRELQHNVLAGPLPKVFTMDEHMCYWDGSNVGVWSGRVLAHDGTLIQEWDFYGDSPDVIGGTHIHLDIEAGTVDWGSGANDGSYSWEVAESDGSGGYILNGATVGDIVLPVPATWDERQILFTDENKKLKVGDLAIKTETPDTGFVFEKEDGGAEHLQMKVTGSVDAGKLLVSTGNGGAEWVVPALELTTSGSTLYLTLLLGTVEYVAQVSGKKCD